MLKGTLTDFKNELLFTDFGINYANLPERFRKGSVVVRQESEVTTTNTRGEQVKRMKRLPTVLHVDLIRDHFWQENPDILDATPCVSTGQSALLCHFKDCTPGGGIGFLSPGMPKCCHASLCRARHGSMALIFAPVVAHRCPSTPCHVHSMSLSPHGWLYLPFAACSHGFPFLFPFLLLCVCF